MDSKDEEFEKYLLDTARENTNFSNNPLDQSILVLISASENGDGHGRVEVVKELLKDPRVNPVNQNNEAIMTLENRHDVIEVLLKDSRVHSVERNEWNERLASMTGYVEIDKEPLFGGIKKSPVARNLSEAIDMINKLKTIEEFDAEGALLDFTYIGLDPSQPLDQTILKRTGYFTDEALVALRARMLSQMSASKENENSANGGVYGYPKNNTDEGIKNLPLQTLDFGWKNITDEGLKNLPLEDENTPGIGNQKF